MGPQTAPTSPRAPARRVLLIANPRAAAGRAPGRWQALLEGLRARGMEAEPRFTEYPRHAEALAREAAGDFDMVIAAGGDGTVNEVAGGLHASGAPAALAIVPLGTGNDVARLLGVPTPAAALAALAEGVTRRIDLIEVRCAPATVGGEEQQRCAVLYAAAGFAGELLRLTTPRVKRLFGARYCYSVGFLRALWSYRAPIMAVAGAGETFHGRFFHVSAGNAEAVGGGTMRLSPGARMDDGRLECCLVDALGRLATLRRFPRLLAGTHVGLPEVRYFPGAALEIAADRPVPVAADGEVIGFTPATFRLLPAALTVVAARE